MTGLLSKTVLFPYFIILKIRHLCYDRGWIATKRYDIPIICVGNITVGGTGKTPHTEMIIRYLSKTKQVAVLSRGYRRKSKGFRLVECSDSFLEAGDEPLQIKQKFPDITVAVCKNRLEGIEKLLAMEKRPDIILLDDAFQYRKIKPSHSILLIDSGRTIMGDNLLPIGRLRDLPRQIKRADTVIITKCNLAVEYEPGIVDEFQTEPIVGAERKRWKNSLRLRDDQALYFSSIVYKNPLPVFDAYADPRYVYSKTAICFSGIANDEAFKNHISGNYKLLDSIKFADHKSFSVSDMESVGRLSMKYPTAVIFTTEKDSKRLLGCSSVGAEVKKRLFYIPIEVEILLEKERTAFFAALG